MTARTLALGLVLATACVDSPTAPEPDPPTTTSEQCEGGLARVDDECIVLEHTMEVLMFRTTSTPYLSTCTRRILSDDPGIEEAVVAEGGGCRVIDTDRYGPANFEPAPREPAVTVEREGDAVTIDEAELFESCMERSTVPDGFFDFDGVLTARFDGNGRIPAFELEVPVPADPEFTRSPYVDGQPLGFTWRAVGADELLIVVAEPPVQIVCRAPLEDERFEVPAEFLAMLPESDPPGLAPVTSIRVRNQSVAPFVSDDAVVTLAAEAYQAAFEDENP